MTPGEIPTTLLCTLGDGSCRTIDELDRMLALSRRQISDGAACLVMRGLLERIEVGCYQLTPAGREAAARGDIISAGPWKPDTTKARKPWRNSFRQRAWNAMRMSATFTIGDIAMAAARSEDANPQNNLQRYFRLLCTAGYLADLPARQRGTGFKRYRLIRDTGPLAPSFSDKNSAIHDHNTGGFVPCRKPS